jgi:nucleoside-diphosphate-sugar epimerase
MTPHSLVASGRERGTMNRHALVTGGAGFVGSHLVDALVEGGWSVTVVDDLSSGTTEHLAQHRDNPAVEVLEADVCGTWDAPAHTSLVLNFASPASPPMFLERPLETMATGSIGTYKVIEFCLRTGARLIQASTSEVYGEPEVHPQPEHYWGNVNPIGPRSVYDEAKRFSEALIMAHVRSAGLDAGIVRIFNTYGPRLEASDGRVVSNFLSQALRGEPITVYGDGTQTRSFCYVSDLVRGVLAMASREQLTGPVNLGNPAEITISQLAGAVRQVTGQDAPVTYAPLPVDDPTQRRPDISLAAQVLGWKPVVELPEGLALTSEAMARSLASQVT